MAAGCDEIAKSSGRETGGSAAKAQGSNDWDIIEVKSITKLRIPRWTRFDRKAIWMWTPQSGNNHVLGGNLGTMAP